jgi:hypothetical protein
LTSTSLEVPGWRVQLDVFNFAHAPLLRRDSGVIVRLSFWLLLSALARAVVAQTTVSGSVYDSVAHAPLPHATVQLVSADDPAKFARSFATDSAGRFSFSDVPNGRYMIGFFHPRLDTLGLDAPTREIRVAGPRPIDVDLAVPGAAQLIRAICGDRGRDEPSSALVGVVRDGQTREPVANTTVAGEWFDLMLSAQGMARRPRRLVATTRGNGWFAICDVPSGGTVSLTATRQADTARIDVAVPADGFLHRDIYFASGARAARVAGVVIAGASRTPLANAQVSIAGAAPVRTNALGEWAVTDAPFGTRALDVRAVGYYPEHRTIDVLDATPLQHIELSTMTAVLDTVRVRAAGTVNRNLAEFDARRRASGTGTFLTREQIVRQNPRRTTDLLRLISGLRLAPNIPDTTSMLVRGAGRWTAKDAEVWCSPLVFIDGRLFEHVTADDVDDMIDPRDIAGMEVYTGITAPPQFQVPLGGCGSIVIWRR